jgi:hypothetical protein
MDLGDIFQMATDWNGQSEMTTAESTTPNKLFTKDLVERTAATFVEGFLGAVSLDWVGITDLGWKAWFVAGAGAGIAAVLKGLLAKFRGNKDSASLTSNV